MAARISVPLMFAKYTTNSGTSASARHSHVATVAAGDCQAITLYCTQDLYTL